MNSKFLHYFEDPGFELYYDEVVEELIFRGGVDYIGEKPDWLIQEIVDGYNCKDDVFDVVKNIEVQREYLYIRSL
jgi:hypothetical protein